MATCWSDSPDTRQRPPMTATHHPAMVRGFGPHGARNSAGRSTRNRPPVLCGVPRSVPGHVTGCAEEGVTPPPGRRGCEEVSSLSTLTDLAACSRGTWIGAGLLGLLGVVDRRSRLHGRRADEPRARRRASWPRHRWERPQSGPRLRRNERGCPTLSGRDAGRRWRWLRVGRPVATPGRSGAVVASRPFAESIRVRIAGVLRADASSSLTPAIAMAGDGAL